MARAFRSVGVFSACVLFCSAPASGQEFSWVPVDASAAYTTARPDSRGQDTEIILVAGPAYIVEFELRISGWGDSPGSPSLGAARAGVNADGFLGANAVPPNPGVDLTPLNNEGWRDIPGGHALYNGAHMVIRTCQTIDGQIDSGLACGTVPSMYFPFTHCMEAGFAACYNNPEFVFADNLLSAAVSTATPNYTWGAVAWGVPRAPHCTVDEGRSYYLGTLILNVPAGAAGSYTIRFDPSLSTTLMNECPGHTIIGVAKTPGHVTLVTGACCTTHPGGGTPSCADGVFQQDCQEGPDIFFIGQTCDDPGFACPSCATDAHCADGVFCNGVETCNVAGGECLAGTDPCPLFQSCDETIRTCRDDSACCDRTAGTCTDQVPFSKCRPPLKFHEGELFCAALPDRDGDGVPDCADLCPERDDTLYAPDCVIPAISHWGLTVLSLMLLSAITVRFGRRRVVASSPVRNQRSAERGLSHSRFFSSPASIALSLGLFAMSTQASGPEFSWVPVDASAAYTTARPDSKGHDTEIILPAGPAHIVEFEFRVSGWGDAPGSPDLGAAQAEMDARGFLGVNASPPNPGVDLAPLINQTWREHPGGNGRFDGAFIATRTCHRSDGTDTGRKCASIPSMTWDPCPIDTSCADNDEFVFTDNLTLGVVSTRAPNYAWGAISIPGACTTDEGRSYYLGTLILNVPAGAVGTYTFGFDPSPHAHMDNCGGASVLGLVKTPGHVTLQAGACCRRPSSDDPPSCVNGVSLQECQGALDIFLPGQSCYSSGFECPSCATDAHCTDGVFCNGAETCDVAAAECLPGSDPCMPFESCDEAAGICREGGACCDPVAGICTDRARDTNCLPPLEFHEGTPLCADIPDADGDTVPDCIDQCPDIDDTIFAPDCGGAIPTTTAWGLAVTALLLLIAGKLYFGRRATSECGARKGRSEA